MLTAANVGARSLRQVQEIGFAKLKEIVQPKKRGWRWWRRSPRGGELMTLSEYNPLWDHEGEREELFLSFPDKETLLTLVIDEDDLCGIFHVFD
jgi:hypothetical protein